MNIVLNFQIFACFFSLLTKVCSVGCVLRYEEKPVKKWRKDGYKNKKDTPLCYKDSNVAGCLGVYVPSLLDRRGGECQLLG